MPRPIDAFETSQRLAIVSAVVFTLAAGLTTAVGANDIARFALSGFAIASLAAVVGQSIDQIGEYLGPGPRAFCSRASATCPSCSYRFSHCERGSRPSCSRPWPARSWPTYCSYWGSPSLSGGARHGIQTFRPEAPRMLVTLLTLAVGAMLVPTLAVHLETPAARHAHALSDATAVILLLVYIASVPFWLGGGPTRKSQPGTAAHADPGPTNQVAPGHETTEEVKRWPLRMAVTVLVVAGATSAFVSDWFVSALVPATTALGITPEFTGLVIVAIASNAVENFAGVRFAWKARSDYAISAILSSPLQIALLLTPVLVLGSAFIGHRQLTLVFPPLLVAALAIAVVVTAVVIYDGEYSWLEGVALIALYGIVATAFWWG